LREEDKKKIMEERAKLYFQEALEDNSTLHNDIRIAVEEVLGQNDSADSLVMVISELIINEYGVN